MAHLYKTRLQTYAQKRNIPLPTYTVETKGPPHCRLFKAQVTIDGNTYAGPNFSSNLKDAEHEAAKVAFMSLSQEGAQEDDSLYKSLLQELAQKKGLVLPVYTTNRTGQPHIPCFSSTVVISGESYVGEDARTKKQSEMNAAKVAYKALTEGGPRADNATAISNTVGTSSSGSSSLQTVMTHKTEPTTSKMQTIISNNKNEPTTSKMQTVISNNKNEPTTSKMQTIISNRASFTIPDDPEKAKGYLELKDLQDVIEKHTMPPVMIHEPQPQSTLDVNFAKPGIKPTNHAVQASEGSGSNGKIIQPFVNEATINLVMDSGSLVPHLTKIVIRPHVQGMTYDGPIQVADEEWVAMKVKVEDGM